MLLAEGHLLYAGNAQGVVAHFERFGLRVPFGTSIAGERCAACRRGLAAFARASALFQLLRVALRVACPACSGARESVL